MVFWTNTEEARLRVLWPRREGMDLPAAFTRHTLAAIQSRARRLGLLARRRRAPVAECPVVRALVMARHEKGLSQTALAARVGIERSMLNYYESGRRRAPPLHVMVRWAAGLGLAVTVVPAALDGVN